MPFDNGNICGTDQLVSDKAKQLLDYLNSGHNPFVVLDECRTNDTKDIILLNVWPELSQLRVHDIRTNEPIAVHFDKQDTFIPNVFAIREDFPRKIPHLNLEDEGRPASLCLYNEPYRDIKPFWTPPRFIERIRTWLRDTASGTLHGDDQPLEPLFLGSGERIILPTSLYSAAEEQFSLKRLVLVETGDAIRAVEIGSLPEGYQPKAGNYPPTAFCVKLPPQEHGVISHTPRNLHDVSLLMSSAGYDLFGELFKAVKAGDLSIDNTVLNSCFCLIGWFPKSRNTGTRPETTDIWVFASARTVADVLNDIGVHGSYSEDRKNGKTTVTSLLLARDETKNGENIEIYLLNPTYELSSSLAATLNGFERASNTKILTIGGGAIGSHIVLNSIKSGFGKWVLVDEDILLPHNIARHALDGSYLGLPKVLAIEMASNQSINDNPVIETFKADFVYPGDSEEKIIAHLEDTAVILDLSASVSVAWHVTHNITSNARRISMFLTPSGKDFIILAEDTARETRLDLLEMLYYRELIRNENLSNHLKAASKTRYANSCRDLSSQISQDHVALHSAIASRNLKNIINRDHACIKIYRTDENMQVACIDVQIEDFARLSVDDWNIFVSDSVIKGMFKLRNHRLPNETGGVLVGFFNSQHRVIYIVDMIGGISDSIEYPNAFIRGHKDLAKRISSIQSLTAGNLTYVGEWHSHPNNTKCWPSSDDHQVISWIDEHMSVEGLPSVMLIAGECNQLCVCINNEANILDCR